MQYDSVWQNYQVAFLAMRAALEAQELARGEAWSEQQAAVREAYRDAGMEEPY